MKVIHVCNVPIPPDHPDVSRLQFHPGRWVLNLAIAQKAHTGIEPQLLVQVPGASRDHVCEIEGIPAHFVAAPDRFRSATLFYFDSRRMAARVHALRPDVVHAHGTEDCYALAAQRSGLPYTITVQGLFFLINRILRPRAFSRERAVEFTEHRCLRRARHVIAKSDYVADALRAQFPHLTLHRIPNTIDARLAGIRGEKEPGVLAFVGVISHRKGLDLLIDAIAETQRDFPDVRLWIFGDNPAAPSAYETQMRTRLTALMGGRVVFHGTVSGFEVACQVARATALVAPSREEMFGNQLVEALAVGTHAIVTDQTAMAENVRRFGSGTIVPQEDAAALARAISALLQSPPASAAAAKSRAGIFADFGPAAVAAAHRQLYEKLLT